MPLEPSNSEVTIKLGLHGLEIPNTFFGGTALPFIIIEKSVQIEAVNRFS